MEPERIAECINTLGAFCGRRDIPSLTPQELRREYGLEQADVMVLFGGSILCGGDVLADAMHNGMAKKYVVVGGAGHTTETLRAQMRRFPGIAADGLPEAELFAGYLQFKYHLEPDYLECRSTNCGNNITYLLDLLKEHHIAFHSVLLCQDAAMQLRMWAGLRKYAPDVTIINYAAYRVEVVAQDKGLAYARVPLGMWDMDRYVTLLMGEIARLSDGPDGYGPRGKKYIAHVEIPPAVYDAFETLKNVYGVRRANPLYASKD